MSMRWIVDLLIDAPERIARRWHWLGPLLARITVGWVFLWAGWGKLGALPQVIENFRGWGVPMAEVMAPFVSGLEFVGGILLLCGLFTRVIWSWWWPSARRSGARSTRWNICWD